MVSRLKIGFFVIGLLHFAGALRILAGQANTPAAGGRVNILVLPFVLSISLLGLMVHAQRARQIIDQRMFAVILCGLALLSSAWSSLPEQTLKGASILTIATLFGLYGACAMSRDEQLRALSWALALAAAASILLGLLHPIYGISDDGTWRGLFTQKNQLARVMGLGLVSALIGLLGGRQRLLNTLLASMAAGLIVLTRSASALLLTFAMLPWLVFLRLVQTRRSVAMHLVVGSVFVAGGAAILELTYGTISSAFYLLAQLSVDLLGKNFTLTGRDLLWKIARFGVAEKPLLGYGYGVFWIYPSIGSWSVAAAGWPAAAAHNAFFDTMLDLGLTGLASLAGFLSLFFVRAYQTTLFSRNWDDTWPLVAWGFIVLSSLDESGLTGSLFWVLLVASPLPSANEQHFSRTSPADPTNDRLVHATGT